MISFPVCSLSVCLSSHHTTLEVSRTTVLRGVEENKRISWIQITSNFTICLFVATQKLTPHKQRHPDPPTISQTVSSGGQIFVSDNNNSNLIIPAGDNHPTHSKDPGTVFELVTGYRLEKDNLWSRKEKSPKSLEKHVLLH